MGRAAPGWKGSPPDGGGSNPGHAQDLRLGCSRRTSCNRALPPALPLQSAGVLGDRFANRFHPG